MYFLFKDKDKVDRILDKIAEKYNISYQWGKVKLENWMDNWKDSFKPIQIDDKVMIVPDWDKKNYDSKYVIKICPAMAFGTGHHESTQLVISQMLRLKVGDYGSLLDLGTGSGILAILASKMGIEKVRAIDVDDVCEENFYQNCKLSNVENIDIQIKDVHMHNDYDYDIILANIDKNNIIKILDKYQKSQTNAIMILAGILNSDLDEIRNYMPNCKIEDTDILGEWASVVVKNKVSRYD
jgi:ribosomal protein L11 methyltransferase